MLIKAIKQTPVDPPASWKFDVTIDDTTATNLTPAEAMNLIADATGCTIGQALSQMLIAGGQNG